LKKVWNENKKEKTMTEFNGSDYQSERDRPRLTSQHERVFEVMKDSFPRTLGQIASSTGDPESSISAQLRHMRKPRFGGHTVVKEHLGSGLYTYRLIQRMPDKQLAMEL
tara:strand:+ start:1129 stop:1455 length:327 start_codon:yes stop_codon:yes gene_type:complete